MSTKFAKKVCFYNIPKKYVFWVLQKTAKVVDIAASVEFIRVIEI